MRIQQDQLQIKIFWDKNFLGISLNQISFKHKFALTPYYFWPKIELLQQLKLELNSKLWLSKETKIETLKIVGNVMNYWLSYRKIKTVENFRSEFANVKNITIKTN